MTGITYEDAKRTLDIWISSHVVIYPSDTDQCHPDTDCAYVRMFYLSDKTPMFFKTRTHYGGDREFNTRTAYFEAHEIVQEIVWREVLKIRAGL